MKRISVFINLLTITGLFSIIYCQQDPTNQIMDKNDSTKVNRSDEEWRKLLTPLQYHILREQGTEHPFTGKYDHFYELGHYECAACGNLLFGSETKYNSGCGWPAFYDPAFSDNIITRPDSSLGMNRIEVLCAMCKSHLGHVFKDGPPPTGLRYCINSASLSFVPDKQKK